MKHEIRKMCNFRQANLCGSRPPFNRAGDQFDVIFLRNVMLYFSQETRRALMLRRACQVDAANEHSRSGLAMTGFPNRRGQVGDV